MDRESASGQGGKWSGRERLTTRLAHENAYLVGLRLEGEGVLVCAVATVAGGGVAAFAEPVREPEF